MTKKHESDDDITATYITGADILHIEFGAPDGKHIVVARGANAPRLALELFQGCTTRLHASGPLTNEAAYLFSEAIPTEFESGALGLTIRLKWHQNEISVPVILDAQARADVAAALAGCENIVAERKHPH